MVFRFCRVCPSDRIGLVAFSGKAYIACPLTLDHDFLDQNIDRLKLHMIEDGTAIGSGLSAAVNRLRDMDLAKPPGVAETLDWVTALDAIGADTLDQQHAADTLGAVVKDLDDLELVAGSLGRVVGDV